MIFATSDPHFNHENIIRICRRPWPTINAMNAGLVLRWNSVVENDDTVYVLGDFAFKTRTGWPLDELFDMLNGRKHLVVGNHDRQNPAVLRLGWESVSDLAEVKTEKGNRFILCHYPFETWYHSYKGTMHLHGHCHGDVVRTIANRWDVGVDCNDYRPWPLSHWEAQHVTDPEAWANHHAKATMHFEGVARG